MSRPVKVRKRDYLRLRKLSDRHGIPLTEVISDLLRQREVKKLDKKEELDECQECGAKVPKDSVFCPYCGVEFEEEEEEEEEE